MNPMPDIPISDTPPIASNEQRHQQRMQRKKIVVDTAIATAQQQRGVLIINTGNGKGKSSAAFGMLARALGHNMRVAVVQFSKGRGNATGEELFFRRFDNVAFHVMGEGFTWETQDKNRDKQAANHAWQQAKVYLTDAHYDMVLLDELNIVLKHHYLDIQDVIQTLQQRPGMQHVVITGRAARQELIDIADTVSDLREVKHAFKAGVKAQKGVEL